MENKRRFSVTDILLILVFIYGWATMTAVAWTVMEDNIIPGCFSTIPAYPVNIYIYGATNLLLDVVGLLLLFRFAKRITSPAADTTTRIKVIGLSALFGCILAVAAIPHYRVPETLNRPAFSRNRGAEQDLPQWQDVARCRQNWRNQIGESSL